MPKRRNTGRLPEPPWSFAPSEVGEWMASTAGSKRPRPSRSHRPLQVKAFTGRLEISSERKLRKRLSALGFAPADRRGIPFSAFARAAPRGEEADVLVGKLGRSRVRIRLRTGPNLEVRASFSPRVPFVRAARLMARIGLRETEGTWT